MKKTLTILLIALFTVFTSFAQKAGDKISFSSKDINGQTITSEIFSNNKLTMINMWGTFCPPCIREMPDLAELNKENASNGVQIAGIIIDLTDGKGNILPKQKKDADLIIEKTGATYTHIVPNPAMFSTFLRNIQAVPSTIFVDNTGKMVGEMYLGARSKKEWQKIIDDLLKEIK